MLTTHTIISNSHFLEKIWREVIKDAVQIFGSIIITTQNFNIPMKLLIVRNRNEAGEYIILLTKNCSLSNSEVIRLYSLSINLARKADIKKWTDGGNMFKREEYIKNIAGGLARIQSELNLLNPVNLYDIDIISEDFFTGLLNLVYGYELQNANHENKNAEAIDLFDKKNRITVQVTHDNSSNKIQETIDKFVECRLYDNYERLVFFLLRDKKNYTKVFDAKELFHFDIQNDIMDISDLIRKIRTLDTKTLRAVDGYCANEIDDYRQCNNKWNRILCIIGTAFILIFVFFIKRQYTPVAKVYASNIYPYTNAGNYSSYEEFPTLYKTEIEADKAFAIMSSIRNLGEKVSSVEQQYCEILSMDPIEEADVRLDADIVDNTLYLFAFNNGWGNTDAPVVSNTTLIRENINIEIGEVFKNIDYVENAEIKTAGAVLIAKYVFDSEALEHYFEDYNLDFWHLYIQAEGENYDSAFFAYLSRGKDGFDLDYGGGGDWVIGCRFLQCWMWIKIPLQFTLLVKTQLLL